MIERAFQIQVFVRIYEVPIDEVLNILRQMTMFALAFAR